MNTDAVVVSARGGIVLGMVVCDGFYSAAPIRVQTHIHVDHMADFETSKGCQTIVLSEATRELLVTELDADLPFRSNIKALEIGPTTEIEGVPIQLLSSGHMLGSVQVGVTLEDGIKLAYSGDFNWPIEDVMHADVLVVDSTYGSPDRARQYSQEEVNTCFLELVLKYLRNGPVHIKAHRGTLERALELLDGATSIPLIATQRLCAEVSVYQRFGYNVRPVLTLESAEAKAAIESGQYVRMYGPGDGDLFGVANGTAINLSAYMASPTNPVLQFSDRSFRIAMTCHADFNGTLEYIQATGAQLVITDNIRGGHGIELASAIKSRLGIDARPSEHRPSRFWGE